MLIPPQTLSPCRRLERSPPVALGTSISFANSSPGSPSLQLAFSSPLLPRHHRTRNARLKHVDGSDCESREYLQNVISSTHSMRATSDQLGLKSFHPTPSEQDRIEVMGSEHLPPKFVVPWNRAQYRPSQADSPDTVAHIHSLRPTRRYRLSHTAKTLHPRPLLFVSEESRRMEMHAACGLALALPTPPPMVKESASRASLRKLGSGIQVVVVEEGIFAVTHNVWPSPKFSIFFCTRFCFREDISLP
jgi:hypothetical protein